MNKEPESIQFTKLLADFIRELEKEGKSHSYITEHVRSVRELFVYAEESNIHRLEDMNQWLIDDYVVHLENERLNERKGGLLDEGTVSKRKNCIRQFWKYLNAEGHKVHDIRMRHKRKMPRKMPVVLSHEEIKQLYSVCDESPIGYRDRAMLAIYYGCGMRKTEGLKLVLTDIDFGKGRIHLHQTKTNRERYVMMSPIVQKQIEEYVYSYRDFYLPEGATEEGLFIGERGKVIKPETLGFRIAHLWDRVKDVYGSEKTVGCHTLRHSIGTHLYMAGMNVEMVALMLGHRTLEATQLYIHSANNLKR